MIFNESTERRTTPKPAWSQFPDGHQLEGIANDVAVDSGLGIAAISTGGGGLQLVDISEPVNPLLIDAIAGRADHVELLDGLAFVVSGNQVRGFDLLSGEEVSSTSLPVSTITGFANDGDLLYAYGAGTFSIIDPNEAQPLANLNVSIASFNVGLTVGNGVAFLAGSGITSIDISDPFSPTLISAADNFFTARDIRLNGSGIAINVAEDQGITLFDVTNPDVTDSLITQIDTPGFATSIAIASGIAFVADGFGGLQVINYLPFDFDGVAPTIFVDDEAIDADPSMPGVQVEEGTTVPLSLTITDDVQVRNVELIVDGQVVSNDVSFPFDFSAVAPNLSEGTDTFSIQVRATDTGGNSSISNPIELSIIPDITPPEITSLTPSGATLVGKQLVSVTLNEPIDMGNVSPTSVQLRNQTSPEVLVSPESVTFQNDDRTALFQFAEPFPLGQFELSLNESDFNDRAGNPLGDEIFVQDFDVLEATAVWINPNGGFWDDPANWEGGVVPGPDDGVLVVLNEGAQIIHRTGDTEVARLTVVGELVLQGGTLDAGLFDVTQSELLVSGGTLTNTVVQGQPASAIELRAGTLDGVILNVDALLGGPDVGSQTVTVTDGLTVNGMLTIGSDSIFSVQTLQFDGTQTVDGTGQIVLTDEFGETNPANNALRLLNVGFDSAEVLTIADELTVSGFGTLTSNDPTQDTINFQGQITGVDGGDLQLNAVSGDITLDDPFGSVQLRSNVIDLTVNGTQESNLRLGSGSLSNVTLNVDALLGGADVGSQTATVTDGLTVNGTLTIGSDSIFSVQTLQFDGTQTVDGTGQIVLTDEFGETNPANNALRLLNTDFDSAEVLTIGPDLTIIGEIGSILSSNPEQDSIRLLADTSTRDFIDESGSVQSGRLEIQSIELEDADVLTIGGDGVTLVGRFSNGRIQARDDQSLINVEGAVAESVFFDVPVSTTTGGTFWSIREFRGLGRILRKGESPCKTKSCISKSWDSTHPGRLAKSLWIKKNRRSAFKWITPVVPDFAAPNVKAN